MATRDKKTPGKASAPRGAGAPKRASGSRAPVAAPAEPVVEVQASTPLVAPIDVERVKVAEPTTIRSRPADGPASAPSASGEDSGASVAPVAPTEPLPPEPDEAPPTPPSSAAAEAAPAEEPEVASLKARIRSLEVELDRLLRESQGVEPPAPASPPAVRGDEPPPLPDDVAGGSSPGELLPPSYYLRHWGRQGLRSRAEEVDEFGLDPAYEARWRPVFDFLYRHYFRVDTEGASHVPSAGRCLIVSNHSGGPLPYDGIMLRAALRREHPEHRELRWLAEDFVYYLPFVGTMMNRLGAVRACQENAERLLSGERAVAVFPEGAKGIGKLYRDRYKLQRFGRGGFIRLCLRTGTPVVPCAVVGAEEANPTLRRVESMTKALGIPLPVTPTFPLLGPLGLLPAPTKWRIRFGEPVRFEGYGPEAADDEILVGRLAERVRATIQAMVDRMVGERQSVWFG
jgi:1-acyl-sn-glycerol-3-phosphate acyltransferase